MFCSRRKDGKLVKGGDPMNHMMPYVMRGRNESAVYFRKSFCVENVQKYIAKKRRQGIRITIFNIIVATFVHILYRRPHINRFIAGRKLYQRNKIDVLYVVKTLLTDEGTESIAKVSCDGHDTLDSITEKMSEHIKSIQDGEEDSDDRLISSMRHLPRAILRAIVSVLRFLDFHGLMPQSFMDAIPMYSSVFISHIGSLGAEAPFHHLYEFGTTSIFCTIGKIYKKPYQNVITQELEWRRTIDITFTVDERICDGFYLTKTLRMFENYIDQPELLEKSPIETDLDYKKKLRQNKVHFDADASDFLSAYWDNMLDAEDWKKDIEE